MQILRSQKVNLPKKYVYLSALLISILVILQVSSRAENNTIFLGNIVLLLSNYLVWALGIEYIYGAIQPFKSFKELRFTKVLEVLISLFFLVIIHLLITNVIYYSYKISISNFTFIEAFNEFKPFVLKSILSRFFDVFIIAVLLKIIETYNTVERQKTQVVSLENQLHLSQLETLRSQLNPHFLFNTLHTLNSLIGYDDKKAKSMVIKVTNLLRKILEKREQQMITLAEEMDYFKNYLDIEEERFHDRLEVVIDVDDKTKDIQVPTLLLQPLIENAFKHGISHIEGKGIINLKASLEQDILIIKLSNSIPKIYKIHLQHSTKVGLQNLKSRLDQIYSDAYEFSTEKKKDTFEVTIKINTL